MTRIASAIGIGLLLQRCQTNLHEDRTDMDGAIALCQWLSNKIEYNIRAASQILQLDNTNAISSQKKKKKKLHIVPSARANGQISSHLRMLSIKNQSHPAVN
ncbi:uncharacterized protein ASPGLDRAFT_591183 [Aspergillus glaucus CBS 516.65]|uniref:Uncharacterized protein n=1 Tax=Aspergillus glaucus CBS 516.65 TaxID=1160497 RepID=A0A1L9VD84_ASPGL|nr:hypothetical protein ASPGLDRAFT_591183 [Aspergillus glaucus CBS 516.65]OJJ81782.1 hypothetical protein ASPGLDRAFT_591183 [Aspergillus glaucus CBS 516.65]